MREVHSSLVGKELIDFLYRFCNLNSFFSQCSHLLASPGITICPSLNTSSRIQLLQADFDYSGIEISGPIEPVLVYRSKLQQEHHNHQDTALALQQLRSNSNPFPQGPGSVYQIASDLIKLS